ncbi:MAG: ATPase, partial [Propionibacteriaceae bacterium]
GAWGIATLAAFTAGRGSDQTLADYLDRQVFAEVELETIDPDPADVDGFEKFIQRYVAALPVERAAVDHS